MRVRGDVTSCAWEILNFTGPTRGPAPAIANRYWRPAIGMNVRRWPFSHEFAVAPCSCQSHHQNQLGAYVHGSSAFGTELPQVETSTVAATGAVHWYQIERTGATPPC